ncbi:MAG TPA: CrcB family protein [Pseudolysinimonas sp.]|nr:CrcB family protein [Pseudolysinimonas sp.]
MSPLVVLVALVAGALGALARYAVTLLVARRARPQQLPRAVFIVNVAGCFIAGAVLPLAGGSELRSVLLSGLAAGLTTFSTWTVETVQLALGGRGRAALASVLLNLVVGAAAAVLGMTLVSLLL